MCLDPVAEARRRRPCVGGARREVAARELGDLVARQDDVAHD